MTPYYDDGTCVIYHADCREVLPALQADLILTDFPYGVGMNYGEAFEDTPEGLDELIATALPLMQESAPVTALTCGIGNWWRFPPTTWVLCWRQLNSGTGSGRWGFNMWQPVLVYGGDPYLKRLRGRRSDVIEVGVSGHDLVAARDLPHPCPKPLGAWKAILLRASPDTTDVVLDPFMGSGTTLAVAKAAGRKAIGIEIEERFCEVAASRLTQAVMDFGGAA